MSRSRILIVDDEPYVRKTLQRALNVYDVKVAGDGREAVTTLENEDFDVVLCDLMMPSMSGVEVFRHVHASAPEQAERFVFLTGGTVDPQTDEFLSAVSNPVLEKPFNFRVLRHVVKETIKRHRTGSPGTSESSDDEPSPGTTGRNPE